MHARKSSFLVYYKKCLRFGAVVCSGAEEAERLAASHKAALKAKEQECSSANQKLQVQRFSAQC